MISAVDKRKVKQGQEDWVIMLNSGHLLTGMTLGEKIVEGKDYGHEDDLVKNGAPG